MLEQSIDVSMIEAVKANETEFFLIKTGIRVLANGSTVTDTSLVLAWLQILDELEAELALLDLLADSGGSDEIGESYAAWISIAMVEDYFKLLTDRSFIHLISRFESLDRCLQVVVVLTYFTEIAHSVLLRDIRLLPCNGPFFWHLASSIRRAEVCMVDRDHEVCLSRVIDPWGSDGSPSPFSCLLSLELLEFRAHLCIFFGAQAV